MVAVTIQLANAGYSSAEITANHLGANVVFTKDYLDPGGPFDRFLKQLDVDFLRFPGGTVTEVFFEPGSDAVERFFSMALPSGLDAGGAPRILTAPAAFDYASTNDMRLAFTLPTNNYLSTLADADGNRFVNPYGAYRLLDRVDEIIRGEYGDVKIDMFQIGNEFWYSNDRETATEYGRIANDMAVKLGQVFDLYRADLAEPDTWVEPKIAIQVAQGWKPEDNQAILDQLTPAARAEIDVLTQHFYPGSYHVIANSRAHFDRLDQIAEAPGFNDLEYYLSEWNVKSSGDDTGLKQASSMLEITRTFMERGVDYATVWGTQYQSLQSRLAELYRDNSTPSGFDYRLTVPGELFNMMNPALQGLQVLDLDTDPALRNQIALDPQDRPEEARAQVVMHAFGSDERVVLFISSRTDITTDITIDPGSLLPSWHHLYGQSLGAMDDPTTLSRDEGDPTSQFARPHLEFHTSDSLLQGDQITFSLGAYEIMKLEFSRVPVDLRLEGASQLVNPAADYDDEMIGGSANDLILGFNGDDVLRGAAGHDTLFVGAGDDSVFGDDGHDLLIGGSGRDQLFGGAGEDTLVAGDGDTFINGDAGRSHFLMDTAGRATIEGFDTSKGDTLSFLRAYATPEEVLDRTSVVGDDLIITHDQGGFTQILAAAAQIEGLSASLSDFDTESPVADLIDAAITPEPDGSIPPDPEEPPPASDPVDLLKFERLINSENPDDVLTALDSYSTEELSEFNEAIHPSLLVLTAPPFVVNYYLAELDDAGRDSFFERLDESALINRLEERLTPTLWQNPNLDEDVLDRVLSKIGEDGGERLIGGWTDTDLLTLVETIESRGLEPATYDMFKSQQERIEALRADPDPEPPLPPIDPPPEEEEPDPEEDEEDQQTVTVAGGGCFIATCAYGDPHHPSVEVLRMVRDLHLSSFAAGRMFIRYYYRHSPGVARQLSPHPWARAIVRGVLEIGVRSLLAVQMRRSRFK